MYTCTIVHPLSAVYYIAPPPPSPKPSRCDSLPILFVLLRGCTTQISKVFAQVSCLCNAHRVLTTLHSVCVCVCVYIYIYILCYTLFCLLPPRRVIKNENKQTEATYFWFAPGTRAVTAEAPCGRPPPPLPPPSSTSSSSLFLSGRRIFGRILKCVTCVIAALYPTCGFWRVHLQSGKTEKFRFLVFGTTVNRICFFCGCPCVSSPFEN